MLVPKIVAVDFLKCSSGLLEMQPRKLSIVALLILHALHLNDLVIPIFIDKAKISTFHLVS